LSLLALMISYQAMTSPSIVVTDFGIIDRSLTALLPHICRAPPACVTQSVQLGLAAAAKPKPTVRARLGRLTVLGQRLMFLCQNGWCLAKVRDAIRMATWTRSIRRFLLNNGAASPSHPCAGKYGKTSKPPRFTNLGQEPTFLTKHSLVAQLRDGEH